MLYSYNGEYPGPLPERIRLSNGMTRTDSSSFTEEEIKDSGFFEVDDIETIVYNDKTEKVIWNGKIWEVLELTDVELENNKQKEASAMRIMRNTQIEFFSWKIEKYNSEVRRGVTPTDDISEMDEHIQKLRDIPQQEGFPYDIVWPQIELDPTIVGTEDDSIVNPESAET